MYVVSLGIKYITAKILPKKGDPININVTAENNIILSKELDAQYFILAKKFFITIF